MLSGHSLPSFVSSRLMWLTPVKTFAVYAGPLAAG